MTPIPRLRRYEGTTLLSYGFRPFFLFGSLYAGLAVLLWLAMFNGELSVTTAFAPRDWHIHEMLYGYLPAVMTGFVLTAIPNWTGRLPLQGKPLLALVIVWFAGRLAVATSGAIGWLPAAAIDGGFLLLVGAAAAREIVAGSNWRNLPIVALITLFACANVAFHIEAHVAGLADYSTRIGLALAVTLISIIGGRIIPSFTRNWLARENPGRLPVPFGRFDVAVIAAGALTLVAWTALPNEVAVGVALLGCGLLHTRRLARWAGDRAARDPLVLILHLGYAFVPLGFVLVGLAALDAVPAAAGIHAWAGGAIGTMTLAVMTRASLGHTNHRLIATRTTQAIYLAVLLAALGRIAAALVPWGDVAFALLCAAGILWTLAFLGFGVSYGPILVRAPGAPS
jgi:uncharacterized protein involved in response to NO